MPAMPWRNTYRVFPCYTCDMRRQWEDASRRVSVVRRKRAVNTRRGTAVRIEDQIAAIARQIPQKEWDKVPTDLSCNVDHYLYGAPKR